MRSPRPSDSRCRACGREAGIAFEPLAPEAAMGANPVRVFGLEDWLAPRGDRPPAAPYTLCDECSDNAAAWYLPEFARWAHLARGVTAAGPPAGELDARPAPSWATAEFFNVRPARFVKHALTMLLAITPAGFLDEHPELGEFAADPRRRGLPARYQLYLALYHGPYARFVGYSAQLNPGTGHSDELVELACTPFSLVLSLAGEAEIETTNITDFAELGADETCIVDLDLLNGFGHTPYPADFRTRAGVERDREADRRAA
jgi:hypothetical protein